MFSRMHGNKTYNTAGLQPYLITEISEYLNVIGITSGDRKAKYVRLLRLMDALYITNSHEKTA